MVHAGELSYCYRNVVNSLGWGGLLMREERQKKKIICVLAHLLEPSSTHCTCHCHHSLCFVLVSPDDSPERMTLRNNSSVTMFILVGLSEPSELQLPLFLLFLGIYMLTMVGNMGLTILIALNSSLHTPMYFFLFNLSFIDLCYSCVFTPKMLNGFVSENTISYVGCMTQLFFFCFFVNSECYVLVSMAYDRFVAICNPLLYTITMSSRLCSLLMLGSYVIGFAGAMAHTGNMLRLTFCDSNVIDHYLCEVLPLLKLSCTSTCVNELVFFIVVGVVITVSSISIFISYALILSNILRIPSAEGRSKAFSTCGSHLTAVALFFGSGAFAYLTTSFPGSMAQGKLASIFYTNVVPMLNPLIYSLRNKDVKLALDKTLKRVLF
ncbi:olfactory receptor 8B4 [Oryctolagus cuniculus]|uniref:olfactory receptor 8B4 n=1 Tax=Oryctolagus cuniculus TaxID=9986 RepID=UPI0038792B3B